MPVHTSFGRGMAAVVAAACMVLPTAASAASGDSASIDAFPETPIIEADPAADVLAAPAADAEPVQPLTETIEVDPAAIATTDSPASATDDLLGALTITPGTATQPEVDTVIVDGVVPQLAIIGVTWDLPEPSEDFTVRLRSKGDEGWSGWADLELTGLDEAAVPVGGTAARGGTDGIVVLDATWVEVELTAPVGTLPANAAIHVVDPGEAPADETPLNQARVGAPGSSSVRLAPTAGIGAPEILPRAQWGADESMRTWPPRLGEVTGVVVHHTATTNDYEPADVPRLIRGFYSYHALTRGWGDIGYNIIVDRFGRVWEGRYGGVTLPITGAHASGVNATMFGISIIGDFTSVDVPEVAFKAAAQAISWKFAVHGITMDGTAKGLNSKPIARLIGHREVANTSCPGDVFFPRLGELGDLVRQYQPTMPTYSQAETYDLRLAGPDRYGTSAAVSNWAFGAQEKVYIATGAQFADALAGAAAADESDSALLLVSPSGMSEGVRAELQRLAPRPSPKDTPPEDANSLEVVILGGTNAVSSAVEGQVTAALPGLPVTITRVAGEDRYQTAAQLAEDVWPEGAKTVYLSSGATAADALSAGPVASMVDAPLLLTASGELPAATKAELARLAPEKVVITGGTGAVSQAVLQEVEHTVPAAAVTRVGGADRYETSALLVNSQWTSANKSVFFATGANWPDALSAGAAAGYLDAPVLLVRPDCVPAPVRSTLSVVKPTVRYLVGGTSAISEGALVTTCR